MNEVLLSDAVKNLREDSGQTQLEVRKALGLTKSAYSSLETGIRNLKASELLILLDFYGVSIDEFIKYGSEG